MDPFTQPLYSKNKTNIFFTHKIKIEIYKASTDHRKLRAVKSIVNASYIIQQLMFMRRFNRV